MSDIACSKLPGNDQSILHFYLSESADKTFNFEDDPLVMAQSRADTSDTDKTTLILIPFKTGRWGLNHVSS